MGRIETRIAEPRVRFFPPNRRTGSAHFRGPTLIVNAIRSTFTAKRINLKQYRKMRNENLTEKTNGLPFQKKKYN